jgi:integrase
MTCINIDPVSQPSSQSRRIACSLPDLSAHAVSDWIAVDEKVAKPLRPETGERHVLFLLGCMAGLRRREIDLLEWSSFRWNDNAIEIKPTNYFSAKSEDSYGVIEVDTELMAAFRGFRANAKAADFVIKSHLAATKGVLEPLSLPAALQGLDGVAPRSWHRRRQTIHVLRKEFGSRMNSQGNIYDASRALRHADINITAQSYTDKRDRVTTGFGHLFKAKPTNVVPMDIGSAAEAARDVPRIRSETRLMPQRY